MNNVDHINGLFADYFGNKIKVKEPKKVKPKTKSDVRKSHD